MNRAEWEKQIHASDLNPTARLVALVVGSFGNWTEDREIWPSTQTIGEMAGMTRGTVGKYMDAFVEQGWLEHVRNRPGNGRVYKFLERDATVESFDILAKVNRGQGFKQLSNDSTSSCRMGNEQLSNGEQSVVESFDKNLKEPTTEEPTTEPTTESPVSDEPVDSSSNSEVKEDGEMFLKGLSTLEVRSFEQSASVLNLDDEQRTAVLTLITNRQVRGTCFEEKMSNALAEIGVEVW